MAIPPIAPYRMPGEDDLPPAAVPWRPRPDRAVVLVHDMQRYFLRPFPAGRSPLTGLLANTAKLLAAARAAGVPVMYTAQPGGMTREERGLLHDFWGPGMGREETDRAIVDDVVPEPGETVLTKWRYSAFVRSDLEERMRRSGRDQLVVCGVYAYMGCLLTACDAYNRDIQPFLVADALADLTLDDHLSALRYAAERCGVPLSTADTLAALETGDGA
ncbi:bifunctional isochorismate lyase/aryl carrier protein [Actinomadura pelletieri DSM 43383]|uniref:Bifunctional isochorismate lyase/aryl carrier protein n=1 Tax=Actinomadura pelletieri DSM 43383 TaxID=1120940 RepID=A0A495QKP6_9ACTN|nr:isochorismatase family protein [Actinomadura pelletieri]RKS73119.1 bifunctional isochorismate lyase/aryl carrier protein [Actinomadura pelletieri DSM 43383]